MNTYGNSLSIYKFGGASISTVERIKEVPKIIKASHFKQLFLVFSAMGKTTNALEKVVEAHQLKNGEAVQLLEEIKQEHLAICGELFVDSEKVKQAVSNHFVEVYWQLEDEYATNYDYDYDQIVGVGELVSSTIMSFYLKQCELPNTWVDARSIIKTNRNFRAADVEWESTNAAINQIVKPILEKEIVVSQGFIGSTSDNETTTLGREGSDFTGAILANCLQASELVIWKDVEGVLNADPKLQNNTVKLHSINYKEAVEMAYYGAKVIHPKTIKPLQNKGVPLIVRSFLSPTINGSTISGAENNGFTKAIYILKQNQVLLTFGSKDFSFFNEDQVATIMHSLAKENVTINLMQRGAVECSFVVNFNKDLEQQVLPKLSNEFIIDQKNDLRLETLRHYKEGDITELKQNKSILLEQRNPITYQIVWQE